MKIHVPKSGFVSGIVTLREGKEPQPSFIESIRYTVTAHTPA